MKSRPYLLEVQSGGNGADVAGVVAFLGFLSYISFMVYLFLPMVGNIPFFSEADTAIERAEMMPRFTSTPVYPHSYTGVTIGGNSNLFVTSTLPPVVPPTYTAYPTYTPLPTLSPQFNNMILNVQYSYYWPPLLGPNCHPDNVLPSGGCKDTTASGEPWTKWRGKGVAIPIQWLDRIPFYSIVRVISPPEMIGDYTVVDLCGGCIKAEYPDLIWFDFLDDHLILNWSSDLVVEIIPPQ